MVCVKDDVGRWTLDVEFGKLGFGASEGWGKDDVGRWTLDVGFGKLDFGASTGF